MGRSSRPAWAAVTVALTAVTVAMSGGIAAATVPTSPDPGRNCRDVWDTVVSDGRVAGCVEVSAMLPLITQNLTGSPVMTWVDIGSSAPLGPTACTLGQVSRADGWTWRCVQRDGQRLLEKVKPWARPVDLVYSHTASRSRAALTVRSTAPLTGCRLTASDAQLLRGVQTSLSGRLARRTLDGSGLRSGIYTVGVACRDNRLSSVSDLRVLPDGSLLLRSDCLDAWHDGVYANVVPGYGRRLDAADAAAATTACRALAPLTADEYQRAGREAYLRIGQIAEREVRRVSASRGIPICEAISEVFKPVDTVGRRLPLPAGVADGITVPVAGYLPDGYFPVLYREWNGGPIRMDNVADCGSGNQSLRLTVSQVTCPQGIGVHFFTGTDADPHQTYPLYVFDRTGCPASISHTQTPTASVCIVWGDRIGNDVVGGVGKVFAADAASASGTGAAGPQNSPTYDCQDRALRSGQFANVDVSFMPTLR